MVYEQNSHALYQLVQELLIVSMAANISNCTLMNFGNLQYAGISCMEIYLQKLHACLVNLRYAI
jgi:hypothetical protein